MDIIKLLPWELDGHSLLATCACYEALKQPIRLKNGSLAYPSGFLRFLKITPEEILNVNVCRRNVGTETNSKTGGGQRPPPDES